MTSTQMKTAMSNSKPFVPSKFDFPSLGDDDTNSTEDNSPLVSCSSGSPKIDSMNKNSASPVQSEVSEVNQYNCSGFSNYNEQVNNQYNGNKNHKKGPKTQRFVKNGDSYIGLGNGNKELVVLPEYNMALDNRARKGKKNKNQCAAYKWSYMIVGFIDAITDALTANSLSAEKLAK